MKAGGAPLVLASASPRRREILERLGLSFEVRPSAAEEVRRPDEPPEAFAERAAREKVEDVAAGLAGRSPAPFVLGADTVVVVEGAVLGKPADDAEALRMLRLLSGRWHRVLTGLALGRAGTGLLESCVVTTDVRFRVLSEEVARRYVATGEGRDKAGAYAVQGTGSGLVREVRGSYDNVVGLPAVEVLELLERRGALEGWP
ncbi:MAG: Maf family protein [Myxococcota bacterium]